MVRIRHFVGEREYRRRGGGGDEDWVDLFILVPIENIVEALFHVESTSGVVKDSMASMGTVMSTSQIDGDAPLPWPVPKSE